MSDPKAIRISSVEYLGEFKVRLRLVNGTVISVDLREPMYRLISAALTDVGKSRSGTARQGRRHNFQSVRRNRGRREVGSHKHGPISPRETETRELRGLCRNHEAQWSREAQAGRSGTVTSCDRGVRLQRVFSVAGNEKIAASMRRERIRKTCILSK